MKKLKLKSDDSKAKAKGNRYKKFVVHIEKPENVSAYGGLSLVHRLAGVVGFANEVDNEFFVSVSLGFGRAGCRS